MQEKHTYKIRILENDKATEVATTIRRGAITPNQLITSLIKEEHSWDGVLYEEDDLAAGIAGEWHIRPCSGFQLR